MTPSSNARLVARAEDATQQVPTAATKREQCPPSTPPQEAGGKSELRSSPHRLCGDRTIGKNYLARKRAMIQRARVVIPFTWWDDFESAIAKSYIIVTRAGN